MGSNNSKASAGKLPPRCEEQLEKLDVGEQARVRVLLNGRARLPFAEIADLVAFAPPVLSTALASFLSGGSESGPVPFEVDKATSQRVVLSTVFVEQLAKILWDDKIGSTQAVIALLPLEPSSVKAEVTKKKVLACIESVLDLLKAHTCGGEGGDLRESRVPSTESSLLSKVVELLDIDDVERETVSSGAFEKWLGAHAVSLPGLFACLVRAALGLPLAETDEDGSYGSHTGPATGGPASSSDSPSLQSPSSSSDPPRPSSSAAVAPIVANSHINKYIRRKGKFPLVAGLGSFPHSVILNHEYVWYLCNVLSIEKCGEWTMLFSSQSDGLNFNRLMAKSSEVGPVLVLVRDSNGGVFGGLTDTAFTAPCAQFYGGSACSLFSLHPTPRLYKAAGLNSNYMYLNYGATMYPNGLGMGGQLNHFSLWISSDFETGHSKCGKTFENECLATSEDFRIDVVESWALTRPRSFTAESGLSILDKKTDAKVLLDAMGVVRHSDGIREPVEDGDKKEKSPAV